MTTGHDRTPEDETVLRVGEEVAHVDKRRVVTGRVRVTTATEVAEEMVEAELKGETWEVTRVPIDQEVSEPPSVRSEGDVTIVPVLEEVLTVEKRLVLKEELHIRRSVSSETVRLPVAIRRQRATVERDGPEPDNQDSKE